MSLSMKLEQILVQKLVSSQAKKFQEKRFSNKVRIVLARIARLRKSMLRLLILGKTAANNEKLQVPNFLTYSREVLQAKTMGNSKNNRKKLLIQNSVSVSPNRHRKDQISHHKIDMRVAMMTAVFFFFFCFFFNIFE